MNVLPMFILYNIQKKDIDEVKTRDNLVYDKMNKFKSQVSSFNTDYEKLQQQKEKLWKDKKILENAIEDSYHELPKGTIMSDMVPEANILNLRKAITSFRPKNEELESRLVFSTPSEVVEE